MRNRKIYLPVTALIKKSTRQNILSNILDIDDEIKIECVRKVFIDGKKSKILYYDISKTNTFLAFH